MGLDSLPDFVVADINNLAASDNTSIRIRSYPLTIPLTDEDKRDAEILMAKFNSEGEAYIAGLAAPQIGILKRMIVISVPDIVAQFKRCQTFPKMLLINPTYDQVSNELDEDYEQCFSVKDVVGPVKRFKTIYYKAHDITGKLIEGVAVGFLARLIQHETDHLNGKLYVDIVDRDKLMLYDDYIKLVQSNKLRPDQSLL